MSKAYNPSHSIGMKIKTVLRLVVKAGYDELPHNPCKGCGGVGSDDNTDFFCTKCHGSGQGSLMYEEAESQLQWTTNDKFFWQSLALALGWEEYCCEWCGGTDMKLSKEGDSELCKACSYPFDEESKLNKKWLFEWHRYIDHMALGGSEEDFFENINR